MDSQIVALSERVARLEKANRAMKFVIAITVLGVVAMNSTPQLLAKTGNGVKKMAALDAGSITANTINVQQINLVNSAGKTVAIFGSEGNSTGLIFLDQNDDWLMALGDNLGANPTAGLAVYDGNSVLAGTGKTRVGVGISPLGAALQASYSDGHPALTAGVSADNSTTGVQALDDNGNARAGLGNGTNGSGFFAADANNVTRYVAGVTPNGTEAGSSTYDATGKPQLELGGLGDGSENGMVSLDGNGQDRFDAGYSSAEGGGLIVKDASGNIIYFAPPAP